MGLGRHWHILDTVVRYGAIREFNPEAWNYSRPTQPDPRWGWNNRPGTFQLDGEPVWVNSEHLRALREYSLDKPPGKQRLEIFGDSFIFGVEGNVPDDKIAASRLASELPNTEVMNFGVPGYGLDQMLLRFEQDGARYHPDIVVIPVLTLLLERCFEDFGAWFKPYFRLEGGRLALYGVPVPGLEEVYHQYLWRPRLLDVFQFWDQRIGNQPSDLTAHILARFIGSIRRSGGRALVVLAPFYKEYSSDSKARQVFQSVCASEEAECIDAMPAFNRADALGLLRSTGFHWNSAGNQVFVDEIVEYLKAHPTAEDAASR